MALCVWWLFQQDSPPKQLSDALSHLKGLYISGSCSVATSNICPHFNADPMRSMSCTILKHASGRIILFCLNNHIILCTWWEECRRTLRVHLSLHQCSFYTLPSLPFQFPQLLHSTQWCLNNWKKKETNKKKERIAKLINIANLFTLVVSLPW